MTYYKAKYDACIHLSSKKNFNIIKDELFTFNELFNL